VRTALIAGLTGALVELIPILFIQNLLGVSVTQVFQSIASGIEGASAYHRGLASAMLGLGLHLFISTIAAGLFAATSVKLPILRARPVAAGLLFGIGAYVLMSYIVLPLSAVAFPPATDLRLIATSLAVHMLAFGLPIALVTRRLMR
jgi:hypothetical protein